MSDIDFAPPPLPALMDLNTISGVSDFSGGGGGLSGNNDWNNPGALDNARLLAESEARAQQLSNESMANSLRMLEESLRNNPNPSSVNQEQLISDLYPSGLTDLQRATIKIPLETAQSQAQLQTQLANSGNQSSAITDTGDVYNGDALSTDSSTSMQDQINQILNNSNTNLSGDSFTSDQLINQQTNQILNNPYKDLSGDSFLNYPTFPGTSGTTDFISSLAPSIFYDYTTPFTPGFSQSEQTLSASLPQFGGPLPYAPSELGSGADQASSGIMSLRNADNTPYLASAEDVQPSVFDSSILPADNQTLARNLLGSDIYNPEEMAVQQAIANYSPEADLATAGAAEAKGRYTGTFPGSPVEAPTVAQKDYSPGVNELARAVFQVESKNIADAKNPQSSATGVGQFVSGTWLEQIAKNYPELGTMKNGRFTPAEGYTTQDILDMRKNPEFSADLTKSYLTQIGQTLKTDDPGTLYLGYFLGTNGARSLLNADPSTPVSDLLTPKAINANYSLLGGGKTAGEIINSTTNRIENALNAPRPAANVPYPTARPQDTAPTWVDNLPETIGRKVVSSGGDYMTAAGLGALFPPAGAAYGIYTLGAGIGNLLTGSNTFPTVGNAVTNQVLGAPRSATTGTPTNAAAYTNTPQITSTAPVPALDAVRTNIAPAGSFSDLYGNVSPVSTAPYTGSFADRGMEIPQPPRRPFDTETDYGYASLSPSINMNYQNPADINPLWDVQYDQSGVFTVGGPRVGARGQTVSPYSGVEPLGPDQTFPEGTDFGYGPVNTERELRDALAQQQWTEAGKEGTPWDNQPTPESQVPADYVTDSEFNPSEIMPVPADYVTDSEFDLPSSVGEEDPNTYATEPPIVPRGTTIPRPVSPAYTAQTDQILNSLLGGGRIAGGNYLSATGGGCGGGGGGGGGGDGGGEGSVGGCPALPSSVSSPKFSPKDRDSLLALIRGGGGKLRKDILPLLVPGNEEEEEEEVGVGQGGGSGGGEEKWGGRPSSSSTSFSSSSSSSSSSLAPARNRSLESLGKEGPASKASKSMVLDFLLELLTRYPVRALSLVKKYHLHVHILRVCKYGEKTMVLQGVKFLKAIAATKDAFLHT